MSVRTLADYVATLDTPVHVAPAALALEALVVAVDNHQRALTRAQVDPWRPEHLAGCAKRLDDALAAARLSLEFTRINDRRSL